MSRAAFIAQLLKDLKRVRIQWFGKHADKEVINRATATITRMERQRKASNFLPSERDELLNVIHLLDQYIVAGRCNKYVGSNLERRVNVILESRK